MTEYYTFECGCKFPILDNQKLDIGDGLPPIEIDLYNVRLDCPKTYELLATGRTLGVFQLEKDLGQGWSKKLKPENQEQISALGALLRPSCIKGVSENGKSVAQNYVDRKNNGEIYSPIHESIADITAETYGLSIYQEQHMKICQKVAGFDLKQADSLRKAMGKKDAALMAKTRIEFLDGCKKTGIVPEEKAIEIFDMIEKANRYSFNKCYALDTTVETKNGHITLDDVCVGEYILAPDSHNSDNYVEILDKVYNGEKELYEITTESGKTITCTLDHKLLCEDMVLRPLSEIIEDNWQIMCKD
jgi:DNA polymerase-3 subunit alpha